MRTTDIAYYALMDTPLRENMQWEFRLLNGIGDEGVLLKNVTKFDFEDYASPVGLGLNKRSLTFEVFNSEDKYSDLIDLRVSHIRVTVKLSSDKFEASFALPDTVISEVERLEDGNVLRIKTSGYLNYPLKSMPYHPTHARSETLENITLEVMRHTEGGHVFGKLYKFSDWDDYTEETIMNGYIHGHKCDEVLQVLANSLGGSFNYESPFRSYMLYVQFNRLKKRIGYDSYTLKCRNILKGSLKHSVEPETGLLMVYPFDASLEEPSELAKVDFDTEFSDPTITFPPSENIEVKNFPRNSKATYNYTSDSITFRDIDDALIRSSDVAVWGSKVKLWNTRKILVKSYQEDIPGDVLTNTIALDYEYRNTLPCASQLLYHSWRHVLKFKFRGDLNIAPGDQIWLEYKPGIKVPVIVIGNKTHVGTSMRGEMEVRIMMNDLEIRTFEKYEEHMWLEYFTEYDGKDPA